MAGLSYLNYYMLEDKISVDEYIQKYGNKFVNDSFNTKEDFAKVFYENTGIKNISICNTSLFDMFKVLIDNYLSDTTTDVENIKYIVLTDVALLQEQTDYIGYSIKDYFKMKNASVILVDQHCSSTALAFGMLSKIVSGEDVALVLSSCKIDRMENRFVGYSIKGEAVGIAEIKSSNYLLEIKDFHFTSCAKIDLEHGRNDVILNGVNNIGVLLKRNELTIEQVDRVLPQNVNKTAYECLYTKYLKCKKEKFFLENICKGGHLGDVDTIVNIKDFVDKNHYQRIVIYSIGAFKDNYNYNSLLLEKV